MSDGWDEWKESDGHLKKMIMEGVRKAIKKITRMALINTQNKGRYDIEGIRGDEHAPEFHETDDGGDGTGQDVQDVHHPPDREGM